MRKLDYIIGVAVTSEPDWTAVASESTPAGALAAAASLLETETFEKSFAYDALGRVTSATMPDQSEVRPTYNEASLLEKVEVRIRGALTWTTFVDTIDYDAHGRRTQIVYGNSTSEKGDVLRGQRRVLVPHDCAFRGADDWPSQIGACD